MYVDAAALTAEAKDPQLIEGSHRTPVKGLAPTKCVYAQDLPDGSQSNGEYLKNLPQNEPWEHELVHRIERPWRARDDRKGTSVYCGLAKQHTKTLCTMKGDTL